MAIAYFAHRPVGKSTQPKPYRAVEHARYIMRRSAMHSVFSEGMPRQYHAVQRFLEQHEDGLRKNGRVCDKFIIAIPREFTPEAAEAVLRSYGRRIGHGKAPFLVALHWDDNNPHAHMVFIDRDPDTGRRVFGTTERGSTEKLKLEWAAEVNDKFQELGLGITITFGPQEIEAANDNEVSEPLQSEVAIPPDVNKPLPADPPVEEELPEPAITLDDELTVADRARFAHMQVQELNRIHALQRERQQVKDSYHSAVQAYEASMQRAEQARLQTVAAEADRAAAKQTLVQEHTSLLGGKKGFSLKVFGYEYISPARKAADAAESVYYDAIAAQENATRLHQLEQERLAFAEVDYKAALDRFENIIGDEAELEDAAALVEQAVNDYAGDLTADTILEMLNDGTLDKVQAHELLDALGYTQEANNLDAGIDL